jgi:biofilm PGA synthesis N-glycosyltransferase PgaC
VPIKIGGIDLIAVITARMKGWQTRSFLEHSWTHHRSMGTAQHHALRVAYRGGRGDFMLGSHPLWELCRCLYQMTRRPFVLAGLFRLAGFTWAMAGRSGKLVPAELVRFRRGEQMKRLGDFFKKTGSLVASRMRKAEPECKAHDAL